MQWFRCLYTPASCGFIPRGSPPSACLNQKSRGMGAKSRGPHLEGSSCSHFYDPGRHTTCSRTSSTVLAKPKLAVFQDTGALDSLLPQKTSRAHFPDVSLVISAHPRLLFFPSSFTADVNFRRCVTVGSSKTTFCCLLLYAPSPK